VGGGVGWLVGDQLLLRDFELYGTTYLLMM
jgi:hypothetical protein